MLPAVWSLPRLPAAIDGEHGPSCLQVDSVVCLFRSWPFLLMSRVSKAGVKNIVHVQAAAALPMRRQSLTIYLSTNSKRLPRRARPPSELVLGRFTGSRQSDLQGCLGPCCRVEGRNCLERTRTQAVSLVAEGGSHEAHEVKAAPTAAHGAYEAYNVGQDEPPPIAPIGANHLVVRTSGVCSPRERPTCRRRSGAPTAEGAQENKRKNISIDQTEL